MRIRTQIAQNYIDEHGESWVKMKGNQVAVLQAAPIFHTVNVQSVPWCIVHDAQETEPDYATCWAAPNDTDERGCVIEEGVAWKVVADDAM